MSIPVELRERDQWVCHREEVVNGRETRVPYRADGGGNASSTDPATWSSYAVATDAVARFGYDGTGFVVTADDDIVGGDLDDCRLPHNGAIHKAAREIVYQMNTYTEVSPSGCGLRFFGTARLPANHPCRKGSIEIYSRARYFTVTGQHLDGTPRELNDINDALHWLFRSYFPLPLSVQRQPSRSTSNGLRTDHELIEKALNARNGDRFARLWNGDWQSAGFSSQSEADLGLLSHLAYWCDGNVAQMTRLFEQSGLCRPKWLKRGDYRTRTLARALAGVGHA
jgi:putative DNA primase/helicase